MNDTGLPLTMVRFWQEVFIASIRAGNSPMRAEADADYAVKSQQRTSQNART